MNGHLYLYENQIDNLIQQYNEFIKFDSKFKPEICLSIALYSLDHQHYFYKFFQSLANNKSYQISITNSNHAHFEHTTEIIRFTKKHSCYTISCSIHK